MPRMCQRKKQKIRTKENERRIVSRSRSKTRPKMQQLQTLRKRLLVSVRRTTAFWQVRTTAKSFGDRQFFFGFQYANCPRHFWVLIVDKKKGIKMDIDDIIEKYLIDNGFDGLCQVDCECACLLDDLFPCGDIYFSCRPGFKIDGCTCGEGCDFHVSPYCPECGTFQNTHHSASCSRAKNHDREDGRQ